MMKKYIRVIGTAALMSAMFAMASFAATSINSVSFTYTVEADSRFKEGYNEPSIELPNGSAYELGDLTCNSDIELATGKTPLTYTLTLDAKRSHYFPDANSISVTGNGITEITRKTVASNDETRLTIKFKAYPYFQLKAPEFTTSFDAVKGSKEKGDSKGRESTVNFNRNGAAKIEYVISYVDQDGELKHKSGTTTNSYINVSAYNKQYTGTSSSKRSAYIRGIAIRSAGALGSNSTVAPSNWVYIAGGVTRMDTDEFFENYTSWDEIVSSKGSSANSSASNSNTSGGSQVNVFGWQGSGDTWYYYSNGNKVKGWLFDGSNWYYCDPATGLMRVGWIQDGGHWYFLNTLHDGAFGCMKTGWLNYNGATYYLNPNAGGPQGAMLTGTHNLGGRFYDFAANGALVQ